ncbi:hypothetical protein VPH35_092732 [Triticum aestivum]
MSTKRASPGSTGPRGDETIVKATTPRLPLDLLVEVAARSDPAAIVRYAAASKRLRGAIIDQDFRRRLAVRAAANGGFNPDLLRGVSYWSQRWDGSPRKNVARKTVPPQSFPARFNASLELEPVAWRDGLVVLRHDHHPLPKFRVCSSFTGDASDVPPTEVYGCNKFALIAVVDHCRSFQLLVADEALWTQIYSSRDGRWSAVRAPRLPAHHPPSKSCDDSHPVVIGRTVHWYVRLHPELDDHDLRIIALHVDTGAVRMIELPWDLIDGVEPPATRKAAPMLVVSGAGELGVVVSEAQAISMWTLSSEGTWRRRVLVDMADWGVRHSPIRFHGFGERSGTLVLSVSAVGLVQLNVVTGQARVLRHGRHTSPHVCVHHINLDSMLQAMKPLLS